MATVTASCVNVLPIGAAVTPTYHVMVGRAVNAAAFSGTVTPSFKVLAARSVNALAFGSQMVPRRILAGRVVTALQVNLRGTPTFVHLNGHAQAALDLASRLRGTFFHLAGRSLQRLSVSGRIRTTILPERNVASGEFYLFEATGDSADGTLGKVNSRWHKSVQGADTETGWDDAETFTLK